MKNRILYIQYTNPAGYPPLEHSSRMLADAGWRVMFLGTGTLGTDGLRFPPHDNIRVKQMPFCPAGWRQKLHYVQYCLWVMAWYLRWRPDWIYASDLWACPIAWLLSFWPGCRGLYHEHDSPLVARHTPFVRLCLMARRALAGRARLCVLPNQKRVERFVEETRPAANVICVWNCPSANEVAAPRPPWRGEPLWILYHGSVVESRLPPTVLRALALLPAHVKLRVIGYETAGSRGYVHQLRELAVELGIASRVEFMGPVSRRELLGWVQHCDAGISLVPKVSADLNLQHMTGASNKPFDYLACGLPVLVTDLPDWRAMFVEPGYGLGCDPDDPNSIADALRYFLEHPEEMRWMGEQGRQRIAAEWNYEKQFSPILDILAGKLS